MKSTLSIFVAVVATVLPAAAFAEGETCEQKCAQIREEGIYEISDGQGGTAPCCCKDGGGETFESRPVEQCQAE